ncbi:MAG: Xaa-Pro peptidase family protein [Syntrophales bacterium]|jgi:Xaa-Pro aminopeptidase|nr:Xaa-Pro peptidase family protein [Syntrophales bacterium]MCK9527497.1 Xaa-Pro peptidase family protein [Syntrophales bacterium]MDX9922553.1 Xaa-Pro peptidase family protein [Syntrophales bacterium]
MTEEQPARVISELSRWLSRLENRNRTARLRSFMDAESIDGMLLTNLLNIRYFCGFSGSEGLLLAHGDGMTLLVDGRYTVQAGRETTGVDIREVTDMMGGLVEFLSRETISKLGFEASALTHERYLALSRGLPDGIELVSFSGTVDSMRSRKDAGEIGRLKTAAAMAARALTKTIESIRPGMQERECAALLDWNLVMEGSEKPSFDTIVASGPNGALPHARPGSRRMEAGDFIVIDYGAIYEGYHSDETCTIALGFVTDDRRRIYDTVRSAHDRAVEAVKPGVLCKDIDARARAYIDDAGFGRYFVHATGHGIGLDVHEAPRLSAASDQRLEEGMVVTVEPGIYIPGVCGVRIEDMVLVTADGCECITEMSKDLLIL